jgi:hypothetical protein
MHTFPCRTAVGVHSTPYKLTQFHVPTQAEDML